MAGLKKSANGSVAVWVNKKKSVQNPLQQEVHSSDVAFVEAHSRNGLLLPLAYTIKLNTPKKMEICELGS